MKKGDLMFKIRFTEEKNCFISLSTLTWVGVAHVSMRWIPQDPQDPQG